MKFIILDINMGGSAMSDAYDEISRLRMLIAEMVGAMEAIVDVNEIMKFGMALEKFKAVLAKAEMEI